MSLRNILAIISQLTLLYNICFSQVNFLSRGIPACPDAVKYTQPDGRIITINLKGDRVLNWAVTYDGFTLIQNSIGTYEYAIRSSEGDLISSSIQANDPESRTLAEANYLKSIPKNQNFSKKQIELANNNMFVKTTKQANLNGFPSVGTKNVLIILVNFSGSTTAYSQTQFNTYANGTTTSFQKYYKDNSYNKLTLNCTVSAWVTVPHNHNYYSTNDSLSCLLVYDAVVAYRTANPTVNFSQFDNNGDGIVDNVSIIHQGQGKETSGSSYDIWSHHMDIRAFNLSLVYDGVRIGPYTMTPEKSNSSAMSQIGVLCHEFGHSIGFPDTYATDYSNEGLGNWDIMAAGAWLGSPSGSRPCNHTAWSKMAALWITVKLINSAQTDTLKDPLVNGDCYRYTTPTSNEYFILENRQKTGWDTYVPGHGLVIYHIDGNYINSHIQTNDVNNTVSHQGIDLVEAGTTLTTSNNGDGTNPFPGTTNQTSFTDNTSPNSRSWANANTNKPITNIVENTTTDIVIFHFMGGSATGLESDFYDNNRDVEIYPNPSGGIIYLHNSNMKFINDVKVYNVLGVKVYENSNSLTSIQTIDLQSLQKGIYFIVLQSGSESFSRKVDLK